MTRDLQQVRAELWGQEMVARAEVGRVVSHMAVTCHMGKPRAFPMNQLKEGVHNDMINNTGQVSMDTRCRGWPCGS